MKENRFTNTLTPFKTIFTNMANKITEEKALRMVLDSLGYTEGEIQYSSVSKTSVAKVYDVKVIADREVFYYTTDMAKGLCSLKNIAFTWPY